MPLALQTLTPLQLVARVPGLSLAEARKAFAQVQRSGQVTPSPALSRRAAAAVAATGEVPRLQLLERRSSPHDGFEKLLLQAPDGARFETVRIPLETPGRSSVCVSSQTGCALGCVFCATGQLGPGRDLEAWEIVEQLREVRSTLPPGERIHGVVFQGMGEPLLNLDAVLTAIAVLGEPSALGVDLRNITVCTVGIPAGILRLAAEAPRVRLAISLGSARPEIRRRLMPASRTWPLIQVLEAAVAHRRATGLLPSLALTLLRGIHDQVEEIEALIALVEAFTVAAGRPPRLTLIDHNPATGLEGFTGLDAEVAAGLRDHLRARGVSTHHRYSGGQDIGAACGQLAGRCRPLNRPYRSAKRS